MRFSTITMTAAMLLGTAVGAGASADTDPAVATVASDPSVSCAHQDVYLMCSGRDGSAKFAGTVSDLTLVKGTLGLDVPAKAVPLNLPGHLGVAVWLVYARGAAKHFSVVRYGDFMARFEDGYFDTFTKIYDPADADCCPKNVVRRRYAYVANALRKIGVQKMPTPQ